MRLCLRLDKLKSLSQEEFKSLNWLPVTYRFKQCVNSIVLSISIILYKKKNLKKKKFNEECPNYLNNVFDVAPENNLRVVFKNYNVHFVRLMPVNLLFHILVQFFGLNPRTHSSVKAILINSVIL